jgi:hypothetical protein
MKKILASLLAVFGVTGAVAQSPKVQMVDPKTIRFSMPTISADAPEVTPLTQKPSHSDLVFHEDEWAQVEFYPAARLEEIKRMLTEYKQFEKAHRVQYGGTEIYLRRINRSPVIMGVDAPEHLARTLNSQIGTAPVLSTASTITGRANLGFTLPLGGGVTLYGVKNRNGIPVLAVNMRSGADDLKLTQAFTKLNHSNGLVLVDWRSQLLLVGSHANGDVQVWRP